MDLSGTVDRIGAICRKFGVESLAPQLAACEEMLGDGQVVDVAVLGQFKAGKSSFLNGLIGAAVVPVDVLTKADLVSKEELASVIEFTRSQAASRTGKEWRILPVSNRPGFEGMRAEVAEYLRERIAGLVGEADSGNRGEEIRAALAELAALESGVS